MRFLRILFVFLTFTGFSFAQGHYQLGAKIRLGLSTPNDTLRRAFFGPGGDRILLIGKKSTQIWSARSGKLLVDFPDKIAPDVSLGIAWQPGGTKFLAFDPFAGKRSLVFLFDAENGKQVAVLQGMKKTIHRASWSRDGKRILTFNEKRSPMDQVEISVWTENGVPVNSIYQYDLVNPVLIDQGRKLLYDRGYSPKENPIAIWDIESGREVKSFDQTYRERDLENHARLIAISPDERLICGYYEVSKGIICWNTNGDESIKFAFLDTKETGDHYFCGFSSDGQRFAVLRSRQNRIELINSATGKVETSIEGPDSASCGGGAQNLSFSSGWFPSSWSPDDRFFITRNGDDKLSFLEVATGRHTGSFKLVDKSRLMDPLYDYDTLSFNPAKPILVSASFKMIRVWDLETGEMIRKIGKAETGDRNFAQWSPDGSLLMTGSEDDSGVLLWEVLPK